MTENSEIIPRIIHYCWFGNAPLNLKTKKYIDSWTSLCPGFQIIRWDESNCNINENQYVSEAYKCKKWAFVSDYFRLKAILEYGGIYLDTDVELLKPLDEFLCFKGFMGFENSAQIATCVIGGTSGHGFFRQVLEHYQNRRFVFEDGSMDVTTNVQILTELLSGEGLVKNGKRQSVMDMELFPAEYFSPKNLATGKITLTENTCAIHHFDASWQTKSQRLHTKIAQIIGEKNTKRVKKIIGKK